MKLQSFYLPIAIFICVCITFVLVTDAYTVLVYREMIAGTNCKIWVTDQNNNRIAGDHNYHGCDNGIAKNITLSDTNKFLIHAKVQGSGRKTKNQGSYNGNTCFHIHGDVFNWWFDQQEDCSF